MQIVVKNSSGDWGQALTQEQFAVVHDHVVACMNRGKRVKDEDILGMLAKANKPVSFLSSILMDVALYEHQPIVPFLGGWLGTDVEDYMAVYNMARDYFVDDAEHLTFDTKTDEDTQRAFMLLIAMVEHAGFPQGK